MTTLFTWQAERDAALATVERNAGPTFMELATAYVLSYLGTHGPTSGEVITDAVWKAGIRANDARAMGPVLMRLSRQKLIQKDGYAIRTKGHGCLGATIWKLTPSKQDL